MTCNSATCYNLWKAARDCREAQKQYFKTRSTDDLRFAKALEKKLDDEIVTFNRVVNYDGQLPSHIAINQPDLFEGGREFHHD